MITKEELKKRVDSDFLFSVISLILIGLSIVLFVFADFSKGYWIYHAFSFKDGKIRAFKYYFERYAFGNSNRFDVVLMNWLTLYFQYTFYLILSCMPFIILILLILLIYIYKQERGLNNA